MSIQQCMPLHLFKHKQVGWEPAHYVIQKSLRTKEPHIVMLAEFSTMWCKHNQYSTDPWENLLKVQLPTLLTSSMVDAYHRNQYYYCYLYCMAHRSSGHEPRPSCARCCTSHSWIIPWRYLQLVANTWNLIINLLIQSICDSSEGLFL